MMTAVVMRMWNEATGQAEWTSSCPVLASLWVLEMCGDFLTFAIETEEVRMNIIYKILKIGFLGYLSYLKQILTMEESICIARHQEKLFNFLKPIVDNL